MDKREKRNEYMRKYNQQYRLKNKEKVNKYFRIGKWKNRGVISEDYNKLYEYYLSVKECENCGIELNQDEATKKCLDHDHNTGLFRQVLCKVCNTMRDKNRNQLGQFI